MEIGSRDGSKVLEPEGLEVFYDCRITKLITTGGLGSHCYQLCTGESKAVWKQLAIPENGQHGILVIPLRRMSNRVDRAPGWMSSTWLPAWPLEVENQERQPGVTEVVLNSAARGLDGRRRQVVLLTDQAGNQSIRMRFSNPESGGNEGLTRPGRAGAGRGYRQARTGQAKQPEAARAPERKDWKE